MGTELSSGELDCIAEIIWRLCEYRGKPEARAAVLQLVARLIGADYAASFIWDEHQQRSTRRCSVNIDEAHLNGYDEFFHQVDLVTPAMRPLAQATNVDRVIQRSQLMHSQFYCDFLKPAGMYHGINVYFFDQGRDVGDLRIWRGAGDQPFGDREEQILKELTPYFVKSLAQVLAGDPRLSQRESAVARLVANGASDKEVARQLGIAYTTVRTHLNNAMNKLECANRTQLSRHF
ncbi:MAG: helix-turn-helix transcriptional regulator [Pseudomonas sp.]|nr:helix-turn-helix transcriptional regulator [Pseudomonas sp.]